MSLDHRYKFSVIVAAYNTEAFLTEAVDSVISQTLGFDSIQLILVNDGSKDSTWDIIEDYQKRYPDNIIGVNKENGGASSARNRGLELAEGKYVNFLDSDDRLRKNCLEKVWEFFEAHADETDVVCVPIKFFGKRIGDHNLNYKFKKKSRIIDLNEEWDNIQYHVNAAFFRRETLPSGYRFDENLAVSEDFKFVMGLLLEKPYLGVVSSTAYMYRKREGGSSLLDGSKKNSKYYLTVLRQIYDHYMSVCRERFGTVPKFVQFAICNDIHYKVQMEKVPYGVMPPEEEREYISEAKRIISEIDDDVILAQKTFTGQFKYTMLKCKESPLTLTDNDGEYAVYSGDRKVYSLSGRDTFRLEFISIKDGKCRIEGRYYTAYSDKVPAIRLHAGNHSDDCEISLYETERCMIDENKRLIYCFSCEFVPDTGTEYGFTVDFGLGDIPPKKNGYGKFFPLSGIYEKMYAKLGGYLVYRKGYELCFARSNPFRHLRFELRFLKELKNYDNKEKDKREIEKNAWKARLAVLFLRPFIRKPIWLFRDRIDTADDNGIAMFEYVNRNHRQIRSYFTISKRSPDFRKAEKIGRTVDIFSRKHKLLYLLSDYVLSSAGEEDVFRPFLKYGEPYKDLLNRCRFIFLQHGIICNDLSGWLNRFSKNVYGFVTSARREQESIRHGRYRYDEDKVWLTGLARYDKLTDETKKIITVIPTWRKYLVGDMKPDGTRVRSDSFSDSEYVSMYRSLLNSERLRKAAREKGYVIQFVLHPIMRPFGELFGIDDGIIIEDGSKTYSQLFRESALLVTDYSSVAFDFAYLRKPVIYYQFDKERFFSDHTLDHGYFSYEEDGFGEVVYEEEQLIGLICGYIDEQCKLKEEYQSRIDQFYAYHDRKNSERIFFRIKEAERS